MKLLKIVLCFFFVSFSSAEQALNGTCPRLEPAPCYWCIFGNMIENDCEICQCNTTVPYHEDIDFGEIKLTGEQAGLLMESGYEEEGVTRAGSTSATLKWDNLRGSDLFHRVPFFFESDPPLSSRSEEVIMRALSALWAQTCIRFEPAEVGDESIIRFKNSSDCSTFMGRKEGIRTIRGCTSSVGEMLKAIMFALGFWSEILRPDRDDYVVLFREHMLQDKVRLTFKLNPQLWDNYSRPFDLSSITNMGPYTFSAYGLPTIQNKVTGNLFVLNRWAYSSGDLRQIRSMYNCSAVRGTSKTILCYQLKDKGLRYRGTANVTESGITCQRWDAQSPHSHSITPSLLTASRLDHNYCRNPDMRDRPWCFTTNSSIKWEYCDVPVCNASQELLAMPTPLVSERGFWSKWSDYSSCSTSCGYGFKYSLRNCVGDRPGSAACPGKYWRYLPCNTSACELSDIWHTWQRWSECNVDCENGTHTRIRYCIGTVGEGLCVGDSVETEACATGRNCPLYAGGECYNTSDLSTYRGSINIDALGNTCIDWADAIFNMSAYPNSGLEGNYCRNPDGRRRVPYCFRRRNNRSGCNVTACSTVAQWGKWSEFSGCSSSCGEGTMVKTRRCKNGHYGEGTCTGNVTWTDICSMTCINGSSFVVDFLRRPRTRSPVATTTPSIVECLDYADPRSYRGTRRWSKSGQLCQFWDANNPWPHNYTKPRLIAEAGLLENFCRTPNPDDEKPWCFIDGFYPMKEECDVPHCPYTDDLISYFRRLWSSFLAKYGINTDFTLWN